MKNIFKQDFVKILFVTLLSLGFVVIENSINTVPARASDPYAFHNITTSTNGTNGQTYTTYLPGLGWSSTNITTVTSANNASLWMQFGNYLSEIFAWTPTSTTVITAPTFANGFTTTGALTFSPGSSIMSTIQHQLGIAGTLFTEDIIPINAELNYNYMFVQTLNNDSLLYPDGGVYAAESVGLNNGVNGSYESYLLPKLMAPSQTMHFTSTATNTDISILGAWKESLVLFNNVQNGIVIDGSGTEGFDYIRNITVGGSITGIAFSSGAGSSYYENIKCITGSAGIGISISGSNNYISNIQFEPIAQAPHWSTVINGCSNINASSNTNQPTIVNNVKGESVLFWGGTCGSAAFIANSINNGYDGFNNGIWISDVTNSSTFNGISLEGPYDALVITDSSNITISNINDDTSIGKAIYIYGNSYNITIKDSYLQGRALTVYNYSTSGSPVYFRNTNLGCVGYCVSQNNNSFSGGITVDQLALDSITSVTASSLLQSGSSVVICNCASTCTQTLPDLTTIGNGSLITVKSIGAGDCDIVPTATQNINAGGGVTIPTNQATTFQAYYGTNWYTLNNNIGVQSGDATLVSGAYTGTFTTPYSLYPSVTANYITPSSVLGFLVVTATTTNFTITSQSAGGVMNTSDTGTVQWTSTPRTQ